MRTPDRRRASALPGGPLAKYRSVGCGTILGMPATRVEASRIVTIGSLIAAGVAALCYLVYSVRAVEPVDFLVYRYAAQAFAAGSNIYEGNLSGPLIVDEGMPFTYTPFAVIFLWPTVLFDWWTAYLLWSGIVHRGVGVDGCEVHSRSRPQAAARHGGIGPGRVGDSHRQCAHLIRPGELGADGARTARCDSPRGFEIRPVVSARTADRRRGRDQADSGSLHCLLRRHEAVATRDLEFDRICRGDRRRSSGGPGSQLDLLVGRRLEPQRPGGFERAGDRECRQQFAAGRTCRAGPMDSVSGDAVDRAVRGGSTMDRPRCLSRRASGRCGVGDRIERADSFADQLDSPLGVSRACCRHGSLSASIVAAVRCGRLWGWPSSTAGRVWDRSSSRRRRSCCRSGWSFVRVS